MVIKGSCHCKATQFEVAHVPETVTRCTCSICSKRGGLWAYYKPTDVRFISDNAKSSYEWRTRVCKINFCAVCGCSTYNETPDFSTGAPNFENPQIVINARLFDDFDLGSIEIFEIDGKNLW